jgi:putative ABC transport system permease protein
MNNYSEISLKYMKQNKKRTALTIMGITLATILIFAIGTFILSFRDAMIEDFKRNDGDYEFVLNHLSSEETEKVINNAEVKNTSISRNGNDEYKIKGEENKGVFINYVDEGYFKRMYPYKIIEGNMPKASEEIIIDTYTKEKLKVKVGDILTLENVERENKNFKVVGVSEPKYYSGISIYAYFDNSKLATNYKYSIAINLKSENNKQKIINKVISDANIEVEEDTKQDNGIILYLTGNGGNNIKSVAIQSMAVFIMTIIMISTIIVIYNSFNISVIERMRYFGILKAIGATPNQIKRIVFKEGFLMGIIALPIGCVLGFLSLKIGVKLFLGNTLMNFENFKVGFYPIVILITAILVAVTIFLSLLGPARKAKKVSAVDAMRNKNYIKLGKIKRRKDRIISKLFGIEGSIACKNIRRTPFRFIVTVLALTVSIILFNVFYGVIDYAKQLVSQQFKNSAYESHLYKNDSREAFSKEVIKELQDNDFLKHMFTYKTEDIDLVIENKFVNKEFGEKTRNSLDSKTYETLGYTKYNNINIIGGNNENLNIAEKYIIEGKFDESALKNGGVILINSCRNSNGKMESVRGTNYEVGDTIKIPKIKSLTKYGGVKEISFKEWDSKREGEIVAAIKNDEFYELPIIAIADRDPFNGEYANNIGIFMSNELSNTLLGDSNPTEVYFNYDNDKDRQNASEYFESKKATIISQYDDAKAEMDKVNKICKEVEFFVYCFIIIISVIAIINILNTISTNLLLRKKEFSTFKAIGMTEKQLKKSVVLEGTLYGIIAAVFGGITSSVLLLLLTKIVRGLAEVKYKFASVPFILSIVCAVLITYIATLAPLKRIEKLTIVEGISDEE